VVRDPIPVGAHHVGELLAVVGEAEDVDRGAIVKPGIGAKQPRLRGRRVIGVDQHPRGLT
jgi:hypothetical protein